MNSTWDIGLHSLALTTANIGSIILGFGVYHLLKPVNQIAVQAPLAALLSILVFSIWSSLGRRWFGATLSLRGWAEGVGTYLAALFWTPLLFIPLHFGTQGYLTAFSNIWAIWLFQLPVNALALLVAGWTVIKLYTNNEGVSPKSIA